MSSLNIARHIEFLADDALEGRAVGTSGELAAALYIKAALNQIPGVAPAGPRGAWAQDFTIDFLLLDSRTEVLASNILAMFPGQSESLGRETIIIGAHYDHLGVATGGGPDYVFNGADDNASGVAVLLEIASVLAVTPLQRTVMFHFYSGEEEGLLGSEYYIENPTRPLGDTVLMINLDMVGRLHEETVEVRGLSGHPVLQRVVSTCGQRVGVRISRKRDGASGAESADGRAVGLLAAIGNGMRSTKSDYWYYMKAGIAVVSLSTGMHADYHQLSDESDRIDPDGAARVGELVLSLLRETDGESLVLPGK